MVHVFAFPLNSKTQISQIILLSNITMTFLLNSDISKFDIFCICSLRQDQESVYKDAQGQPHSKMVQNEGAV